MLRLILKTWKKIQHPLKGFCFLLSLSIAQAFAQSTPTATLTNPNSWVQFRYNHNNSGFNQYLDNPFFQQKWQTPLGQPNVNYSSPPVVLDLGSSTTPDAPFTGLNGPESSTNQGILFVGTTQGKLLALNTFDGSQKWSYQTQGEIYSSPAVLREGTNSRVFFGSSDGLLRAIDVNGNLIWQYQTGDAILSSPTEGMIQNGTSTDAVIVGSNDGLLYCFAALPTSGSSVAPLWTSRVSSPIIGKPALSDDGTSIYIGTQNDTLYLMNAATGQIESKFVADGPIRGSPTIQTSTDGTKTFIYFGAGSTFYMLQSSGGHLTLDYSDNIGTNIASSAALGGQGSIANIPNNLVLIGSDNGSVYVFAVNQSSSNAAVTASFNTGGQIFSSVAATESFFVIGSDNHKILTARLADLTTMSNPVAAWSFGAAAAVEGSPVLSGNSMYIASDDGNIYAFSYASPGPATHFDIVNPSPVQENQSFPVQIIARDANGNIASGYTGNPTLTGTSPYGAVQSLANIPFTASNQGIAVIDIKLANPGLWALTATDTVAGISGTGQVLVQSSLTPVPFCMTPVATVALTNLSNNGISYNVIDAKVDNAGNIYVLNNNFIQPTVGVGTPTPVSTSQPQAGQVYVFNPQRQLVTPWSVAGNIPSFLAVNRSNGNVYVNGGNNTILAYTSSGTSLPNIGGAGIGVGQFTNLQGIAVDSTGYVYGVDAATGMIQKFTSAGVALTPLNPGIGINLGQMNNPRGMAVGLDGSIYIADVGNNRVDQLSSTGSFLAVLGAGTFNNDNSTNSPYDVTVDTNNQVYVSDNANNQVQVFNNSANYEGFFGSAGSSLGQGSDFGLDVDANGFVYVADPANNRVNIFEPCSFQNLLLTNLSATPNPFNPLTSPTNMSYTLNVNANVTITISSTATGQVYQQSFPSTAIGGMIGTNVIPWTGMLSGVPLANGTYQVSITASAEGQQVTATMNVQILILPTPTPTNTQTFTNTSTATATPVCNSCNGLPVSFTGFTSGTGSGLAIDSNNSMMYVSNSNDSAHYGFLAFNLSGGVGVSIGGSSGFNGDDSRDVAVDPIGGYIFTANYGNQNIKIYSASNNQPVGTPISLSETPDCIWFQPDGGATVVNSGVTTVDNALYIGIGTSNGNIYRYDGTGSTYTLAVTVFSDPGIPSGLTMNSAGTTLYVADRNGIEAYSYNNGNYALQTSPTIGSGLPAIRPFYIRLDSSNTYAYVTCLTSGDDLSGTLDVYDIMGPTWTFDHACTLTNGGPFGIGLSGGNVYLSLANGITSTSSGVTVLAGCSTPTPTPCTFNTDENASLVVGQANFTSSSISPVNASSLSSPFFSWQVSNKLIVADTFNNRVLIYSPIPINNQPYAVKVIGQPSFTTNSQASPGLNTLSSPTGVWSDGTTLVIADQGNSRVLIFNDINALPAMNGSADVVIGSPGITGTASNTFVEPNNVVYDGQRLFVADTLNNRVLVFNSMPTTNGASADEVLGQVNFTNNSANYSGTVSATTMNDPWGLAVYNGSLFVADADNQRVLVFNNIDSLSTNAPAADTVIGQSSFSTSASGTSANSLYGPYGVSVNNSKLYIADTVNNRVLIYNNIPTGTTNPPADVVLGQPNMTTGTDPSSPQVNNFFYPFCVQAVGDMVYVNDRFQNRVLGFVCGQSLNTPTPTSTATLTPTSTPCISISNFAVAPIPFDPNLTSTYVNYSLSQAASAVTLTITSVSGKVVYQDVFSDDDIGTQQGPNQIEWDGTYSGVPVANGNYTATLTIACGSSDVIAEAPIVVEAATPTPSTTSPTPTPGTMCMAPVTYLVASPSSEPFQQAYNVALDSNGNAYVSDNLGNGTGYILQYNNQQQYVSEWPVPSPGAVVVNQQTNNVYVATNNGIQEFDSAGNSLGTYGSAGTGAGQFINLQGIALDAAGDVYGLDEADNSVQKFDSRLFLSQSDYLSTFAYPTGTSLGKMMGPRGIAVGANNDLYITEAGNNRVQQTDPYGFALSLIGAGNFGSDTNGTTPDDVVIDNNGNLFVSDNANHEVQVYDPNGNLIDTFGSAGSGLGQGGDLGLAVESSGFVYVADPANNRINIYGPCNQVFAITDLTANPNPFDPLNTSTTISYDLNLPATSVTITITNDSNQVVFQQNYPSGVGEGSQQGLNQIVWNGVLSNTDLPTGPYTVVVTAVYGLPNTPMPVQTVSAQTIVNIFNPTFTFTPTSTPTITNTPTATNTFTNTPTNTATNTVTNTATNTYSPTITFTPTATFTHIPCGTNPQLDLRVRQVECESPTDIKFRFQVYNVDTQPVSLSALSIAMWVFDEGEDQTISVSAVDPGYWSSSNNPSSGTPLANLNFAPIQVPFCADNYDSPPRESSLELITSTTDTSVIPPGGSWVDTLVDIANHNNSFDYSQEPANQADSCTDQISPYQYVSDSHFVLYYYGVPCAEYTSHNVPDPQTGLEPPCNPTCPRPTATSTPSSTNTQTNTPTNTATPTLTATPSNTPTLTPTKTPTPNCVPYSGPMLNLQVACNGLSGQEQQFAARIVNYGSSPITLANVSIVTWLYESGTEDMDSFASSSGQVCNAGGTNCSNVNISNYSTSHGTFPTCTAISGHYANQSVTFTIGVGDGVVIPANGGYWQSQNDTFQFGRNNPQMDIDNWADDYSHIGNGTSCSDNNFHDSPYYALFYNGQLVQEVIDTNGDVDPNSGQIPCASTVYCVSSPAPTATPTYTPTITPTYSPTNSPTVTATSTPTNTLTNTATNSPTYTPTNTKTNTVTNTPTNTATYTPTYTRTNTATNTPTNTKTNTATNTPTSTPTKTPTPNCVTYTGPLLNLEVENVNNPCTTNQSYLNYQIYNWGTSPVTLANMNIVMYVNTGAYAVNLNGAYDTYFFSGTGTQEGSYNGTLSYKSLGATITCGGKVYNGVVTLSFSTGSQATIDANGGYAGSGPGNFTQMYLNGYPSGANFDATCNAYSDYTSGGYRNDSGYVLLYNGSLVQEVTNGSGSVDPNTGQIPCTITYCTPTPTP